MEGELPVWAIGQALDGWYRSLGRKFGPLSRSQRRLMKELEGERPIKVGELADRLALTMAGATRMVDKLEALGYVVRFRDPDSDQRYVHVVLTDAGREALREADRIYWEKVAQSVSRLSREDQRRLAQLLRQIAGEGGEAQR
ncbi:MAG: MarR family transcriptional regulator [Firmicutes bacterium]|nr:MarR family transcriptional regulator [Bacillota bacterium]